MILHVEITFVIASNVLWFCFCDITDEPLPPGPPYVAAHLVAVHHEVVCGDERFENHDPAVTGRALQQRVCQVGDADVQLIGAVDQVWKTHRNQNTMK